MPQYSFLTLKADDSVIARHVAAFADDAEALMYGRRLDGPHDIEVSQDDRLVFRLRGHGGDA